MPINSTTNKSEIKKIAFFFFLFVLLFFLYNLFLRREPQKTQQMANSLLPRLFRFGPSDKPPDVIYNQCSSISSWLGAGRHYFGFISIFLCRLILFHFFFGFFDGKAFVSWRPDYKERPFIVFSVLFFFPILLRAELVRSHDRAICVALVGFPTPANELEPKGTPLHAQRNIC